MATEPRLLMAVILLLGPAARAMGQPIDVGQTSFPLGLAAFPDASECLDPTGCGSEDLVVHDSTLPPIPPVSPAAALRGHRLHLVALDLDGADAIRLEFPRPIANQAGDDLYIGQAMFLTQLGDAQGINELEVRLGESMIWHGIDLLRFTRDDSVTPVVTFSDPELKQDAYQLWITRLDLSEFGLAAGATIDRVFVRGTINLGGSGLDLAVLGNLNAGPAVPALPALGMGALVASFLYTRLRALGGLARRT